MRDTFQSAVNRSQNDEKVSPICTEHVNHVTEDHRAIASVLEVSR